MSTYTLISTGSTTLVRSGPGSLYGLHVNPIKQGSAVIAIDTLTTSNSGANINLADSTVIGRVTYATASTMGPDFIPFWGVHFTDGLTIAASSTTSVTAFWSP